MIKYLPIILSVLLFTSCTDVIEIDVEDGIEQLVVDAWLTNDTTKQEIRLSYSQNYFDNSDINMVNGALVTIINSKDEVFVFDENENTGVYIYDAENNPAFVIDEEYTLRITKDQESYIAKSKLNRVPKIDSLKYEEFSLPIEDPDGGPSDGFLAEFYATDFIGERDTYWIKTTLNNKAGQDPTNISLAFDAGFNPGSKSDGLLFILPIRQSINIELFQDKDKVKVDLLSVSNEAYSFLQSVQTVNGNTGLFDVPAANLPTNVFNINPSSSQKALGFFNISAVSSFETIIDAQKAKPLNPEL